MYCIENTVKLIFDTRDFSVSKTLVFDTGRAKRSLSGIASGLSADCFKVEKRQSKRPHRHTLAVAAYCRRQSLDALAEAVILVGAL